MYPNPLKADNGHTTRERKTVFLPVAEGWFSMKLWVYLCIIWFMPVTVLGILYTEGKHKWSRWETQKIEWEASITMFQKLDKDSTKKQNYRAILTCEHECKASK